MLINIITTILLFVVMKLYRSVWSFASVHEFVLVFGACMLSTAFQALGMQFLVLDIPRSYYIFYFFFLLGIANTISLILYFFTFSIIVSLFPTIGTPCRYFPFLDGLSSIIHITLRFNYVSVHYGRSERIKIKRSFDRRFAWKRGN